ncbi:hypothetical protein BJ138DRAFT_1118523 [Hygrophoropsis aurantiaca]|uniref:Uncharacterized protein n=1 Tax=Hygrophoropsis aurantiaca TaxID=72124 RepID=A0ACB7ZWQ9_9AGAM|nr:hypothetical protein BJ138DRAFT_1118523 [Hygrophoropsis aurantiaca]
MVFADQIRSLPAALHPETPSIQQHQLLKALGPLDDIPACLLLCNNPLPGYRPPHIHYGIWLAPSELEQYADENAFNEEIQAQYTGGEFTGNEKYAFAIDKAREVTGLALPYYGCYGPGGMASGLVISFFDNYTAPAVRPSISQHAVSTVKLLSDTDGPRWYVQYTAHSWERIKSTRKTKRTRRTTTVD